MKPCPLADEEHENSLRQYCHTNHYKNTICYAEAFKDLPIYHQMGLLAHEIGHLIMLAKGKERHFEPQADKAIEDLLGIKIRYRSGEYGEDLQYLNAKDIEKMLSFIQGDGVTP